MAAVFPVGVLLTAGGWGVYLWNAFLLSLCVSLSFILLLTEIHQVSDRTLMPILMTLIFSIAYPLKSYFFAWTAWDPKGLGALAYVLSWAPVLTSETLYESYRLGMIGLGVFLVTASLLMTVTRKTSSRTGWLDVVSRRRAVFILWLVLGAAVVVLTGLNLLAFKLGILRMGVESRPLPFRLGGIIFLSRNFFGLNILLLVLLFALKLRARRLVAATIGIFVYEGLLTAIVSASRGALLLSLAPPMWLGIVTGHIQVRNILKPRNLMLTGALAAVFALTFPLVTAFRTEATERKMGDVEAFRVAVGYVGAQLQEDPLGLFTTTVGTIAGRIGGVENLIIGREALGTPDRTAIWRAVMSRQQLMAVYYTREVLGYNTYDFQITPGLIASFWFLGGLPMIVGGMIVFTLVTFGVNGLCRSRWLRVSLPVAVAIVAPAMASQVFEGTLQQAFSAEPLLFLLVSTGATEIIGRLVVDWSRRATDTSERPHAIADPFA